MTLSVPLSIESGTTRAKSNRGRLPERVWIGEAAGVGGMNESISRFKDTFRAVSAADKLAPFIETIGFVDALDALGLVVVVDCGLKSHVVPLDVQAARRGLTGALDERTLRFLKCWFIFEATAMQSSIRLCWRSDEMAGISTTPAREMEKEVQYTMG